MNLNLKQHLFGAAAVGSLLAASSLAGVMIVDWMDPAHASAAQQITPTRCIEAHTDPTSEVANECRWLGWTVRPRLVVGPRSVVRYSRLPHCQQEDGSGSVRTCSWNFHDGQRDGNGKGAAYFVNPDGTFRYVWAHNPLASGWHWSTAAQSDALGRYDCVVKDGTAIAYGLVTRCAG